MCNLGGSMEGNLGCRTTILLGPTELRVCRPISRPISDGIGLEPPTLDETFPRAVRPGLRTMKWVDPSVEVSGSSAAARALRISFLMRKRVGWVLPKTGGLPQLGTPESGQRFEGECRGPRIVPQMTRVTRLSSDLEPNSHHSANSQARAGWPLHGSGPWRHQP